MADKKQRADVEAAIGQVSVTTSRRKGATPVQHSDDEKILLLARTRFATSSQAWSKLAADQLDDLRFRASEQWPEMVRGPRDQDQRPCLTINRLPIFIRQVTNQQRQSKPAIVINPVDGSGDPQTAEVLQGLIRHIEVSSQADIAYDTACDSQVTIGRGYFRVVVEWSQTNNWEQDIRIKRIRNPFTVYFDPTCQEPDYSDARYAFIVEDMPKDEYEACYGPDGASLESFSSIGDQAAHWMPEGRVRVAEYFYIETTTETRVQLSDGTDLAQVEYDNPDMMKLLTERGITKMRERKVETRVVKWCKITGSKVLARTTFPGKRIPIIPVLGDEIDVNGRIDLRGMVRDAKDPQRMYNYWVSAETEAIALAPRAPFMIAEGQIEGNEEKWKMANRRNYAYLEYKAKTAGDHIVPPPQRQQFEPPIQAIVHATQQADNDLKAVIGYYDASLGERGPEQSGRAILARQKQGDVGNLNWVDNLGRAIRSLGYLLIDIIPKVYDTPRIVRILGEDETAKTVMVHTGNASAVDLVPEKIRAGVKGTYDLGVGHYDVTVTTGPSYQSRRQEAVEAMLAFIHSFPPAAPAMGDLLAENMDWPGAAAVSKRLKRMVPPNLLEGEDGPEQELAMAQGKLQQAEQQMQLMAEEMEKMQLAVKAQTIQSESRERIAQSEQQLKLQLAHIQEQSKLALEAVKTESERMRALIAEQQKHGDRAHDVAKAQMQAAIDEDQQAAGAAVDSVARREQFGYDRQIQDDAQQFELAMHRSEQTQESHEGSQERQFKAKDSEATRTHQMAVAKENARVKSAQSVARKKKS